MVTEIMIYQGYKIIFQDNFVFRVTHAKGHVLSCIYLFTTLTTHQLFHFQSFSSDIFIFILIVGWFWKLLAL